VASRQFDAHLLQPGNKPCRRVSRRRIVKEAPPTRNALRCERRLPCSKRAVSILQLWCTLYLCTSRCSTCISTNFRIPEGKMAKKAKKAKKKTGKKKKK
jgi:hypothetical protein